MFWHSECAKLTGGDRALRKTRHSTESGGRPTSDGWGEPSEVLAEASRMISLCEGHQSTLETVLQNLTGGIADRSTASNSFLGLELENGCLVSIQEGSPAFFCKDLKEGMFVHSIDGMVITQADERGVLKRSANTRCLTSLNVSHRKCEEGNTVKVFGAEHDHIKKQQDVFSLLRQMEEISLKAGNEDFRTLSEKCKESVFHAFQSSFDAEFALRVRTEVLQEESLGHLQHMQSCLHAVQMTVFSRIDDFQVVGRREREEQEDEMKRVRQENQRLQDELQNYGQCLQVMKADLERQKQIMEVEDQTVKEMSALVGTLKEERDLLSSKLKASHEDLMDVQTTISPLAKSRSWLQSQVDALQSKVKALQKSKIDSTQELQETQYSLGSMATEKQDKLNFLKGQVARESKDRLAGDQANKVLLARLKQAEADAERMAAQISNLQAHVKADAARNDKGEDSPSRALNDKADTKWVTQHLRVALPASKEIGVQTDQAPRKRSNSFPSQTSTEERGKSQNIGPEMSESMHESTKSIRKLASDKDKLEYLLIEQLEALKSSAIETDKRLKGLENENNKLKKQMQATTSSKKLDDGNTICGIGIVVEAALECSNNEDEVVIKRVVPGASAELSRCVMAGDRLLEVDGTSVQGMNLTQLSTLILGQEGTTVDLVLRSAITQEPTTLTLTRTRPLTSDARSQVAPGAPGSAHLLKCWSCSNNFLESRLQELREVVRSDSWFAPTGYETSTMTESRPICDVCTRICYAEFEIRKILDARQDQDGSRHDGVESSLQLIPQLLLNDIEKPVTNRINNILMLVCEISNESQETRTYVPGTSWPLSFPSVSDEEVDKGYLQSADISELDIVHRKLTDLEMQCNELLQINMDLEKENKSLALKTAHFEEVQEHLNELLQANAEVIF